MARTDGRRTRMTKKTRAREGRRSPETKAPAPHAAPITPPEAPPDSPGAAGRNISLITTEDRLALRDDAPRAKGEAAPNPVRVNLDALARLAAKQPDYRQPLARALGVERLRKELGRPVRALDATAGLLHDSALMLSLGCAVVACERNPTIAALIADALAHGLFATFTPPAAERFRFLALPAPEALRALAATGAPPDVILFDPMHPPRHAERESTALVRHELRILRAVVGEDADSPQTLRDLLSVGGSVSSGGSVGAGSVTGVRRVVVKAPLRAARLIDSPEPVHTHEAKAVRYDVYTPRA